MGKPLSQVFIWREDMLDGEDLVQSEDNLRHIAKQLGFYYDERDFIRDWNGSKRSRTLLRDGRFVYVSHHDA